MNSSCKAFPDSVDVHKLNTGELSHFVIFVENMLALCLFIYLSVLAFSNAFVLVTVLKSQQLFLYK